jgi:hypothetical protein
MDRPVTSLVLEVVRLDGAGEFDVDKFWKGKKLQIGKVLSVGCVCKGYLEFPELGDDAQELLPGWFVAFKWAFAIPLENDLHQTLFSGKKVLIMNRKDIALYITEEQSLQKINI